MKSETSTEQTVTQTDVTTSQIVAPNGQTYSVLPQAQMQTLFEGQEAIYIPASVQQNATANSGHTIQLPGGQAIIAHPGQIVRAQNNILQGVQALATNNQTMAVSAARQTQAPTQTTASSATNQIQAAQVMQLGVSGMGQTSFPIQIPISTANGGTILQTIPIPLQIMPNIMQANGQTLQVIPQLTQQIQQPQVAQPQIAQILLPGGQMQHVPMMTANSNMVSVGGTSMAQISTPATTSTWSTATTPTVTQTQTNATTTTSDDKVLNQQAAAAQFATFQVVQPMIQHIPGIGQVQVISPQSLSGLTGAGQPITISAIGGQTAQQITPISGQILPGGAQILSAGGIQGEGEPKWVFQTGSAQITQPTVMAAEEASDQPKTRLRRVACSCPNCKDGDRSDGSKKRVHICHMEGCGKVYGKTSHLRAHIRWHNGERPFACEYNFCNKKFTRSDELQRHRRTHTGDKRFKCDECDKRFMRSDHLSKHIKTHAKKRATPMAPQNPQQSLTIQVLESQAASVDGLKNLQYSESSESSDNDENMLTIPEQTTELLAMKADGEHHQNMQE